MTRRIPCRLATSPCTGAAATRASQGRGGAVATDFNGLIPRLPAVIDPARMKHTLDMPKKDKHQLFSEIEPTMVRGIVRGQKEADLACSCMLNSDGIYSCTTPDVKKCMGLSDEPCEHMLVLVIGLARVG